MKITSTRKIVVEDYPAASRDVVKRLAQTLNPFLDQLNTAMGTNLTLADNLKVQTNVVALQAGVSTCQVTWHLNERPTEVRIGQLARPDGSTPTAVFSLFWTYANGVVSCTFLGLDAGKAHNVTLVGQV